MSPDWPVVFLSGKDHSDVIKKKGAELKPLPNQWNFTWLRHKLVGLNEGKGKRKVADWQRGSQEGFN